LNVDGFNTTGWRLCVDDIVGIIVENVQYMVIVLIKTQGSGFKIIPANIYAERCLATGIGRSAIVDSSWSVTRRGIESGTILLTTR